MNEVSRAKQPVGLRFFGQVTASATHDLKNALAIINENAGLFIDYMGMVRRGAPVDPDRIETLAGRILNQVNRADAMLKGLNRFAHSVDDPVATVDLNEILQVLTLLAARSAAMRGVTLKAEPAETPVTVETTPFLLLNSLFLCLEQALQYTGKGQSINLRAQKSEAGFRIEFGPLIEMNREMSPAAAFDDATGVLSDLGAEVAFDLDAGTVGLVLADRRRSQPLCRG
jgi:signal transduction histidine kinase